MGNVREKIKTMTAEKNKVSFSVVDYASFKTLLQHQYWGVFVEA
jgi:hypothetical protein